jgi:hypothetical protein
MINSFHVFKNVIITTVEIAGLVIGKIIEKIILNIPQPSIIAASSIALGIDSKNPDNINTASGNAKATYGTINDGICSY